MNDSDTPRFYHACVRVRRRKLRRTHLFSEIYTVTLPPPKSQAEMILSLRGKKKELSGNYPESLIQAPAVCIDSELSSGSR